MRVCLGGTFEPFHDGHRALLRGAAQGAKELFVGITAGKLARRPDRPLRDWEERARPVEDFLRTFYKGSLTIRALEDPHGPAATEDFDRIVVSPETEAAALAINVARHRRKLAPLEVLVVPHVLGQDLLPISATAIHAGRISAEGKRIKPLQIAVGSANPVKVAAVAAGLRGVVPVDVDARGFAVASGVPEQPRAGETLRGARTRAHAALKAWPGCDYAVGIEAGLVKFPGSTQHLDAQACVVVDRLGRETHGWGPAFAYPDWVTKRALAGEMVSAILGPVANDPRIGSTTGAIGWLTDGRMDRVELTRLAVLMAFVPRMR